MQEMVAMEESDKGIVISLILALVIVAMEEIVMNALRLVHDHVVMMEIRVILVILYRVIQYMHGIQDQYHLEKAFVNMKQIRH